MRRFNYHVFTPFSRFQNLLYLARKLKKFGVQWHLILDADLPFSITADWIHTTVCPNKEPGWFPGHWYQNYWADHAEIVDGDRYIMCSDDDDFEDHFFDTVDGVDGEVIIVSMKRPGDVLEAAPQNMACGLVGGEQIMISGAVLKQFRWTAPYHGDWEFIQAVTSKYTPVFVTGCRVWWNILDNSKPRDYP